MILTGKFVFLHVPKTGGTFVTSVLKRLGATDKTGAYWKHGGVDRIPDSHKHLPVVATLRNPLDWYVSIYEFGYWKRQAVSPTYLHLHPNYPELTFAEFMGALHQFPSRSDIVPSIWEAAALHNYGYMTVEYLRMFGSIRAMHDIQWLHTDHLNTDLHSLLKSYGYKNVDWVKKERKIYPPEGGRKSNEFHSYYDNALLGNTLIRDADLNHIRHNHEYSATE